jgi:ABC-type transport system substrate-binding protein
MNHTGQYWQTAMRNRIARRRALRLAASGGAGMVGLAMLACGRGKEEAKKEAVTAPSPGAKDTSGLLTLPANTTGNAKYGGTLKLALQTDLTTFDPLTTSSFSTQYYIAYYGYPRMLKFVPGVYPNPPSGEVEGDLAEAFEISPDKLQITFKLRQSAKWDPRAPTNSRTITADDVKFSFEKFAAVSPLRGDLVWSNQNPNAPVESVSTPDERTVVFKMKQPDSSVVELFAAGSIFFVMPRESEKGFDPKGEVRGYGPWLLEKYERDTLYVWAKNPNWYLKDKIYPDRIEVPIIKEYAQGLAQFKAGNIYSSEWLGAPNQTDMIQTMKDVPATKLYQLVVHSTDPHITIFGYAEGSPFRDERMRKAVSMITDRELEANFRWNRDKFAALGLPVPVRYHNAVPAGREGYWLDPTDEKAMPGLTKYFKYDPAEAKKLMAAAGYPNGVDTTAYWMGESFYGAQYTKNAELFVNMYSEGGIRGKSQPKLYQTEYLPNYYYAYSPTGRDKDYSGLTIALERTYPTVVSQIFAAYHPEGPRFHGMSPDGRNPTKGDPRVTALIEKMKQEFDRKALQPLVHEFQRYVIDKMYYVPGGPYPTSVQEFRLYWPVIGNYGTQSTFVGSGVWPVESIVNWWIDATKPPLGKS